MKNENDIKLENEMNKYSENVKKFLPIETDIKRLKRHGKTNEEIKEYLGNLSSIFDYVPDTLYHGSPESLDIINSNESTQGGKYVYATDNPVHALFFSIFRNSSEVRAHINETIDENGEYKVKYEIDERMPEALDNIISNKVITIHICDGRQFFKPQGEDFISREWVSKDGQNIIPLDKIHVNVKHFFENLEREGLVEYDKYDKSKDWKTVIDMLSQNYPFGLGTNRGKNIGEFDASYDNFIGENFPDQFNFYRKFRELVKDIMNSDYNMSEDEEKNYKLKLIRKMGNDFLIPIKDDTDKIKWNINEEKLNSFMQIEHIEENSKIIYK